MAKVNPKCPRCGTNEHVTLINTCAKVGGAAGAVAGGVETKISML